MENLNISIIEKAIDDTTDKMKKTKIDSEYQRLWNRRIILKNRLVAEKEKINLKMK